MTLSTKQARFVAEYLIDLNGKQAAIRAGYAPGSAEVTASRLLRQAKVASEIAKAEEDRAKRTGITQDRVLRELARIGFSDLRKAFTPEGGLKRPEDWDDDAAAAISSIEVVTRKIGEGEVEHVAKVKSWDKVGALTLAARHLGMLKDKTELTGAGGGPLTVISGVERADD